VWSVPDGGGPAKVNAESGHRAVFPLGQVPAQ